MARLLMVAFNSADCAAGSSFAQALGVPFDVLALSASGDCPGAEHLYSADLPSSPPADGLAKGIASMASGYTHFAAVSSMQSKDVMARLAGLLDAGMVTDAIAVESPTVFKRPIIAGSVIATVEVLGEPVVITFRPASFRAASAGSSPSPEGVDLPMESNVKIANKTAHGGSRPDLSQAKIIISGGRPLKDAETFERVIGGFADAVGGAVGATRAAVDSGIAPNDLQVGQTGKIVAPDLYIAAGISGSTQHMAGIKDSKTIVAINKDPDAPIFEFADLGLVADLYDAVPELQAKLKG